MTFEKAGAILGVSKAAVSQYLKRKRADIIKIPKDVKKEMEISAERIVKNENLAVKEIIRILKLIKECGCSCKVCKKFNKGIVKQCGMKPVSGE